MTFRNHNKGDLKRRESPKFPKNKAYIYRSANRPADSLIPESDKNTKRDAGSGKLSKFLNIIIVGLVFVSLAYLSYLNTDPVIKLQKQAVPRNETDYYKAVEEEINGSLIYKNKITFNTEKLQENIKNRFPEIDAVVIEIPVFRHRPVVNISVSTPSAILITRDKSYVLDKEGRALFTEDKINDKFDTSGLVSINDASGHPVTLGQPVLTEQQINYIREVINQGKANNIPAASFNLEFGGSAVDIQFKGSDYLVKFSFYEDPRQSSGAYFALREEIESGNVSSPSEYVDLRIPDRAYIK